MARPTGSLHTYVKSSISIPAPIHALWESLAKKTSQNKTNVFIVALRDMAKKEGIADPVLDEDIGISTE